jgi:hypothetical protein
MGWGQCPAAYRSGGPDVKPGDVATRAMSGSPQRGQIEGELMEEKANRIPTRGAAKSYEGFGRAPVGNVVGQSLSESRCMQPIRLYF